MCNLYSITTNQAAIIALFRVSIATSATWHRCRRVPRLSSARDTQGRRRTRNANDALGHATPAAHGRAAGHQHPQHQLAARGWLKPENRCLVPFNSFAEYAPEPNPETKKKDVVWFALNDDRPLTAFAGIWTEFKGDWGTKSKPIPVHTSSTAF
jgi:putative SOS response-associated peptidase YedK